MKIFLIIRIALSAFKALFEVAAIWLHHCAALHQNLTHSYRPLYSTHRLPVIGPLCKINS